MTADEGVATLNPEVPDGSETQDPPATGRRRARSNGQPATTYEYRVYLDSIGQAAVGRWEAESEEARGITPMFPESSLDGSLIEDLRLVDVIDAPTRDDAVGQILRDADEDTLSDRAKVVRAAWQAHVDLEPIAIPVSRVETGRVPCPWRIEHTGLIGGTR